MAAVFTDCCRGACALQRGAIGGQWAGMRPSDGLVKGGSDWVESASGKEAQQAVNGDS